MLIYIFITCLQKYLLEDCRHDNHIFEFSRSEITYHIHIYIIKDIALDYGYGIYEYPNIYTLNYIWFKANALLQIHIYYIFYMYNTKIIILCCY